MQFTIFLLMGLFFIGLQTTLFQVLPTWIGQPDLLFLLIVFIAIHFSTAKGAVLTLILGIFVEVVSGYFLGIYAIAYLLIFFLIKGLAMGLAIDESNHQPPIVALGYLLANGFIYMSTSMLADDPLTPWNWGEILRQLLIITILTVPMNVMFKALWQPKIKMDDLNPFFKLFQQPKGNRYRSKN